MRNILLFISLTLSSSLMIAQQKMTPELLWKVERLSVKGVGEEGSTLYYEVITPNIKENSFDSKYYKIPVAGGDALEIKKEDIKAVNKNISPNKQYKLFHTEVHIEDIKGADVYSELDKSDVYIFSDLRSEERRVGKECRYWWLS